VAQVAQWGYQGLQPHQDQVIAAAEQLVAGLREKVAGRASTGGADSSKQLVHS
jgi:hypothetical protein